MRLMQPQKFHKQRSKSPTFMPDSFIFIDNKFFQVDAYALLQRVNVQYLHSTSDS